MGSSIVVGNRKQKNDQNGEENLLGFAKKLINSIREDPWIWGGLAITALIGLSYGVLNFIRCSGELHGVLDDVYIHFQYARRIAELAPFTYSPGDAPSSGNTSLLYPFLLAPGWLVGFREWTLMIWAFALGLVSTLWAIGLLYRLLVDEVGTLAARLFLIAAVPAGSLYCTLLGGMEGSVLLLSFALVLRRGQLWLLDPTKKHFIWFAVVCALAPLVRPEGIPALGIFLLVSLWMGFFRKQRVSLLISAMTVMPWLGYMLLNRVMFGSFVTNSALAKSYFYEPGTTFGRALDRTLDTLWKFIENVTWGSFDFATLGQDNMPHLPAGIVVFVIGGFLYTFVIEFKNRKPGVGLMTAMMLCGLVLPSATFSSHWGAYRYYVPYYPIFFMLAALGLSALYRLNRRLILLSFLVTMYFAGYGIYNQDYWINRYSNSGLNLQTQQVAMGRYIRDNLPKDSVIGINDAGAIAYFSERRTYDFVGLTTGGGAKGYRDGKGAIYELIQELDTKDRPTHYACYLNWLRISDLVGKTLFRSSSPTKYHQGVGGRTHKLYLANSTVFENSDEILGIELPPAWKKVDEVDVSFSPNEREHRYRQVNQNEHAIDLKGSRYERLSIKDTNHRLADGGRRLRSGHKEEMYVNLESGKPAFMALRWEVNKPALLTVRLDGKDVGPPLSIPPSKSWTQVKVDIPQELIRGRFDRVEVEVEKNEIRSFHYWFFQPE